MTLHHSSRPRSRAPQSDRARSLRSAAAAAALLVLAAAPVRAADPSWVDPTLLEAGKKEGSLVIYSSVNEEEALPIWKRFEEATGIRIDYVRGSDSQLIARMAIE